MSDSKKAACVARPFCWKRDILYPSALIFTAIIFVSYLVFILLDFNVTESRDFVTHIYNGHTDTNTYDYKVGREFAFDLIQLVGFALFSVALSALSLVHSLSYSKTVKRLIHFSGAMFSCFIFVFVLSGTVSSLGFASTMGAMLAVAALYFVLLGVKTLLKALMKRFPSNPQSRIRDFLVKYVLPAFVIFAAAVIIGALLAMFIKVNVVINKVGPDFPDDDRIAITTYETIINPIAPTLQNYLRYLGSALIFTLALSVLFTKLNKFIKIAINFIINGAALSLLWIIQLDIFKELDNVALYTVVGFIAIYLVSLITVSIALFIRARKREDDGEYENQFMPGRKLKKQRSASTEEE